MKKVLVTLVSALVALNMFAQSSAVYYTPVNETVEVGVGFNPQTGKMILSVIEESKKEVDFDFTVKNAFGQERMEQSFDEGTITVIPKTRKVNYYECNYELSFPEFHYLVRTAMNRGKVVINGVEIDGFTLMGIFRQLGF